MKKFNILLSLIVLFVLLAVGCKNANKDEPISGMRSYQNYINTEKRFGVESGDVYGKLAKELFKAKSVTESINVANLLETLRSGKIDAILVGHQYLSQLKEGGLYSDFEYLWVPSDVFLKQSAFVFHNETLREQYDIWFNSILIDGTFQQVFDRWLGGDLPHLNDIPRYNFNGRNGILRVADTGNYPPLSYLDPQGNPIGFGAEMISLFAQHIGMRPDFNFMPYENILPYVVSGRADVSAATLSIDDDRKEMVFFGEPCISTRAVLIVLKGKNVGVDLNYFTRQWVGVISGSLTHNVAQKIGSTPIVYHDRSSAINDVRNGKILGFMDQLSHLTMTASFLENDIFEVIPIPRELEHVNIAAFSNNKEIIDSFNRFLDMLKNDDLFNSIQDRWFNHNFYIDLPLEPVPNTGENGVLKIAICAEAIPYVYINNDKEYSGYSVELSYRFGAFLGKTVEFVNVKFNELIPSILANRADICIDIMALTESRARQVLFSDPIKTEQTGILILKQNTRAKYEIEDFTKFIGSRMGVSMGSLAEGVTRTHLRAIPYYYSNYSAGIEDIRRDRIDGYLTDLSSLNLYAALPENNDLKVYPIPNSIFSLPVGAFSTNQDIIDRFNAFLRDLHRLGILQKMQEHWFAEDVDLDSSVSTLNITGRKGILRVATSGEKPPYSFIGANGRLNGFSVELARLFAAHEDMIVRFTEMEFGSLIPFVVAGRADIGLANVMITEERKKSVIFSDPIWDDSFGIIALNDNIERHDANDHQVLVRDFLGKRIGVMYGTMFDKFTSDFLHGTPIYYHDFNLALVDLRIGRIDGFMLNYQINRLLENMTEASFSNIDLIPSEIFITKTAAISIDQDLLNKFNIFLRQMHRDGTLFEMQNRWLRNLSSLNIQMPDIPLSGNNGVLKIATSGKSLPFSFYNNNDELVGFSIELAKRFAESQGMELEIIPRNINEIIPYVVDERADMGFDIFHIQEEAISPIYYSDPIYEANASVVMINEDTLPVESSISKITSWFKTGIERNLMTDHRWRLLLNGFQVTLLIAILAQLLGTLLGSIICFFITHKNKYIKWIGTVYFEFINRIPIVVLLLITFYVIFANTRLSNIQVAILVFTMLSSVSVADILKKSLAKINPLEKDAARSLGFSNFTIYTNIILPQIIRNSMEDYTKVFIDLIKATAIVGYIAIQDLTRAAEIIRSRTFNAYFPLLIVTLIYFIVISLCVYIFNDITKKINKGGSI